MTSSLQTLSPLAPYVPRTLVEAARRHAGAANWQEWLDGALMHCDITGFTAMSESLAAMGNEGAELMASVLNSFFDTMLAVADAWGGVQMKFGGDAMLLYFEGADGVARGAACGLEMQSNMPQFRRVAVAGKTYELRMRVGIHTGRFFSVSAGPEGGPLQYVLLGHDVNETANIEALARPGQVVVTREGANSLAGHARVSEQRPGVFRVHAVEASRPALAPDPPAVEGVRRYVLPPVADAIDEGHALPAEQRRVTSMFVMLHGTTDLLERAGRDETLRQLNAYVTLLLEAVQQHRGVVLGSDVAEHYDKFIVLFGAPVLQEEHEASAMRCALQLTTMLADAGLDLQHQVGINSGSVFAGEIGSRTRREYTVIGDTVNLAARLMGAAKPGEALVSNETARRAAGQFELRRRKSVRVKGKAEPVRLFELVAARERASRSPTDAVPFVGRETELAVLARSARAARRGQPSWTFVHGDAGIGKSRLLAEAEQRLAGDGWRVLHAAARSHTGGTPFGLWRDPLRAITVTGDAADRGQAAAIVRENVARMAPGHAPFAGILLGLLGLPEVDDGVIAALDAKTRRERLTALVVALLDAYAGEPVVLSVEDVQWSDDASLELLAEVLARVRAPLAVWVSSREGAIPAQLASRQPDAFVRLSALPAVDAHALLAPLVGDEADVKRIAARAHGNPLFMIELAQAPAGGAMPETVNDVVLARLDALRRSDREVLRLASVIGPSFDLESLFALDASMAPAHGAEACVRLREGGFLRGMDDGFAFAHTLTREVAYETLLYADRRRLHRAAAGHIERRHADEVETRAEDLLHHYQAAREWGRVATYGVMAGDRAASIFATGEAVRCYETALAGLDEIGPQVRVDRSVVMERLGDSLDTAGRHREAGDAYFTALSEWLTRGSSRRMRYVHADLRPTAREALICRKISVSYERRSDYGQALSWIESALERLPQGAVAVSAEVMASKSVTLFRKGLYADAIEWGKRAVGLARRSRDKRIMAYAHNMLANSYIEQGALKQAVRHLVDSERLYGELHDLKGQSAAGNNLASCYQLLGNMDRALHYYQQALQADMRLGNAAHAAIIHNNIGEVLLTMGRVHEAREHLAEVLSLYASGIGLAALTGLSEVNLSRCALMDGDAVNAEAHARRGIRLLQGVGAQGLLDEAELQLVEVRIAQGKHAAAIKRCRVAIERARASGARLLEARGLRLLGIALAGSGATERAREELEASAALAREIDAGIEEGRAIIELVRLLDDSDRRRTRLLDRAELIVSKAGAAPDLGAIRRLRRETTPTTAR